MILLTVKKALFRLEKSFLISKKKNAGFSLPETLVYVLILVLLSAVLINGAVAASRSFVAIKINRDIENAAETVVSRITREIRGAEGLASGSVFDANSGVLNLNTKDELGNPLVLSFYVSDQTAVLSENGGVAVPITGSFVEVNSLVFRHYTASSSEAVRIELSLSEAFRGVTTTEKFYDSGIIRSSYENK